MTAAETTATIAKCLAGYLANPWDQLNLADLARLHNALPVYADVGGSLFLSPTGAVLRLSHVDDNDRLSPERDPKWQLVAAVAASEKYPELGFLVPQRPASAPACFACGGKGREAQHNMRCGECFGLGWQLAL
jgi:hypothetical protein